MSNQDGFRMHKVSTPRRANLFSRSSLIAQVVLTNPTIRLFSLQLRVDKTLDPWRPSLLYLSHETSLNPVLSVRLCM